MFARPESWLLTDKSLVIFICVVVTVVGIGSLLALYGVGAGPRDMTWARIHYHKVMVVGVDPSVPPFGIYDPVGPKGIDPDVALELGRYFGAEVRFVLLSYDGIFDALYRGEVDIVIAALRPDYRQSDRFLYTRPYYDAGQIFVGRAGQALPQDFQDLNGRVLAVEFASEGDEAARHALNADKVDFQLKRLQSVDKALQAVIDGTVDYALVDSVSARLARHDHPELVLASQTLVPDPYVIAVRRTDWQLFLMIDNALREHQRQFEEIIARWL